jgi:hypothetical protein
VSAALLRRDRRTGNCLGWCGGEADPAVHMGRCGSCWKAYELRRKRDLEAHVADLRRYADETGDAEGHRIAAVLEAEEAAYTVGDYAHLTKHPEPLPRDFNEWRRRRSGYYEREAMAA